MITLFGSTLNVKMFSPTEPLGIFIIFIGLIFSGIILYVIYSVSTNKDSLEDKKIRMRKEFIQNEKINKLYPKKE